MTAVALTIFNGCQKDEPGVSQLADEVQPQEVVQPDVYVENGYLAFKNIEAVDSTILLLNKMTTSEKEAWENQLGFKSARAEFDALFEEYDKLPTYEAFLAFKEKYKDKLKFNENDPDDCSIDYPYATNYFIPVLNNKGVYKVGQSIINKMVITIPRPVLKSGTITDREVTSIHAFPEDNPNGDYNEFHRKPNIDKRKLKNELYYERYIYLDPQEIGGYWHDVYENGILVYLNQRGQKMSWGKWRDYKTEYSIKKIRSQTSGYPEAQDGRTHISPEVKPSINFYLHKHAQYTTNFEPEDFLPYPDYVRFAADVTFRGFGFYPNDYYTIETPENYNYSGGYTYPTDGWGW